MQKGSREYIAFMQCGICGEGVIAKLIGEIGTWLAGNGTSQVRLQGTYPEAKIPSAPQHTPDNVAHFFLQGLRSLNLGDFDAAGGMFRKALDTGLKQMHPEGRGDLKKRIDNLPVETGVTPAMKQWAHKVRLGGNEAMHDEELFEKDEAEALQSFTQLFLTYAFTLPGMMKASGADLPSAPLPE